MSKIISILFLLFVATSISIADENPNFTLSDLDGNQVSLSDYAGKIVVLDFWAMWCASCREAFPKLNALSEEYKESGDVVVLGINLEKAKPQKVKGFATKAKISYKLLLDPKNSTAKKFQIKGVPTLIIVGKDGKIVKFFRGMNAKTEKEVEVLVKSLATK